MTTVNEEKIHVSELFPNASSQDLLNIGLNAFAFELAAEAFRRRADEQGYSAPLRFCFRGVEFMLQLCPDQPLRKGERKP